MVSTAHITKTENVNSIYVPFDYIRIADYILEGNGVEYTKSKSPKNKISPEDTAVRQKWAEKFGKAMNVSYFSPRFTAEFKTNLDPEELFDLLIDAMKNDKDTQSQMSTGESFRYTPSKTILE